VQQARRGRCVAAECTRVEAAVGAGDQQIAAFDVQACRLERELGAPRRDPRRARRPDWRIAELDRETPTVRDELAERQVAEPPA
jgi:hypothetical protein